MAGYNAIEWQFYPKSSALPDRLHLVVKEVFERNAEKISTTKGHHLSSNEILNLIKEDLSSIGFRVEGGKRAEEKISMPVLFGKNGNLEKKYDVDAYDPNSRTVVEIEAGRGYTNNQFLKDFFEALVMIGIDYLIIAVRLRYGKKEHKDFEEINKFFDALYVSGRVALPLKGLLVIGY